MTYSLLAGTKMHRCTVFLHMQKHRFNADSVVPGLLIARLNDPLRIFNYFKLGSAELLGNDVC